jgi:hypothetical protein
MALSNVGTYSYKPLSGERDFRLIDLLQGAGDDPISLTISHASLDSSPAYKALSYVWGPQHPAQTAMQLFLPWYWRESHCCSTMPSQTRRSTGPVG